MQQQQQSLSGVVQDNKGAGDLLNFLPVAAAAAAAAAVAANGNGNHDRSSYEVTNIHIGNGYKPNGRLKGQEIEQNIQISYGGLKNGNLNASSDLLHVAANLFNGTAAGGGGGGASVAPMNGVGNGKDPSVSTTQVTIPKDVSV